MLSLTLTLTLTWVLAGTIPSELGRCADLASLSLEFNELSGSIPLALGGNCTAAFDYALATPHPHSEVPHPLTDWQEARSDSTDGPRGHHHPALPSEQRRTSALIRLRGNDGLSVDATTLPVDLVDLSSHDLCAYARGPIQVQLGAEVEHAHGGHLSFEAREIAGSVFRSPSARVEVD